MIYTLMSIHPTDRHSDKQEVDIKFTQKLIPPIWHVKTMSTCAKISSLCNKWLTKLRQKCVMLSTVTLINRKLTLCSHKNEFQHIAVCWNFKQRVVAEKTATKFSYSLYEQIQINRKFLSPMDDLYQDWLKPANFNTSNHMFWKFPLHFHASGCSQ